MCGGGAIALYAKALGFEVVASDLAERGALVGRAVIANSSTKLRREDVLGLFREPAKPYRRGAAHWVPAVFSVEQAEWLDRAMAQADERPEPQRSLLRLVIIKAALRLQPMSLLRGTDARAAASGDYDRVSPRRLGHYLKAQRILTPAGTWQLAQDVNAGVFGGAGAATQGAAEAVIQAIKPDVVYLDPPYAGTSRYEREYRALDDLLGDSAPLSQAPPDLPALLTAAAEVPFVVVSYGGPTFTLDELVALVSEYRPVLRAESIPYPHLKSIASKEKNASNREYLIIAGSD